MSDVSTPRTEGETLPTLLRDRAKSLAADGLVFSASRMSEAADEIARLTAERDDMKEMLADCRLALMALPADALGEGVSVETHPTTGESAEMRWPIRDEMIDAINRLLA